MVNQYWRKSLLLAPNVTPSNINSSCMVVVIRPSKMHQTTIANGNKSNPNQSVPQSVD